MLNKTTTSNLKGFSILIVMLGHLVNSNKSSIDYDFRYFAAFAVSVFLILSGYGLSISHKNNGLKDFARKRFSGVVIPYAIATLFVSIALGILFSDPVRAIRTMTLTNPSNPIDKTLWFIYFICMWYVIFFVTYKTFNRKTHRVATILLAAIFIYLLHPFRFISQLNFQFTLHAFSFAVGVMIAEFKERISFKLLMMLSLVTFFTSIICLFGEYSMLRYEVSCLSFGIMVVSVFCVFDLNFKILSFFGAISYEMYLFEGVLLNVSYSNNLVINAILFIFFTSATAYLFKRIINEIKELKKPFA
ncbi:acyltransferase family protein [Kluyvera cryocrescens]|uniref:acyltransferase family protein n=1 Tax=Kluyvera cryocrescens TaxID=580 RepID=UPI002DBC943E|nr:acyltransferase family protein [Kluyvera cryocrescens]MEB6632716.1 acyltransferase [Kluyvera cryocrescens]